MGEHAFLEIDWGAGEQAWKFWVTDFVGDIDGHTHRLKLLSKRLADGSFESVSIMQCEDGEKLGIDRMEFKTVLDLEKDAALLEAKIQKEISPDAVFEVQDFTRCKTAEEWEYMVREGTLNQIRCCDDSCEGDS